MRNAAINAIVALDRVSKRFAATLALDDVSFDVAAGEIHALVGENGAGKSTLIRILGGVHRPDRGTLAVGGTPCRFASPREAIAAGIVTIPQELRLVPALSVAENIALGDLPVRRVFAIVPMIDRVRMREEARALLAQLDFAPEPDLPVRQLGFAERQLVAIARALKRRCRVLILDEPTAALEKREVDRLFDAIERMKAGGTAIIYISHRLDEVVAIADRCTVLRDGRVPARARRGNVDVAALVAAMTGRRAHDVDLGIAAIGDVAIEESAGADPVRLRAGETVGLAGLLGGGADQALRRLFGVGAETAAVRVRSQPRRLTDPAAAIAAGIGMVPGERALGLVMNQSVRDNILLPSLDRLRRGGRLDRQAGDRLVAELIDLLDIRPPRPELAASALSGGNQQKVILAKWLARRVGVLLLEEPTQGIDVAAKAQIHRLVRDFAKRSGAVLVGSSDLAELARLCDAVLAFHRGRVVARLERGGDLDEARLRTAIGGGP